MKLKKYFMVFGRKRGVKPFHLRVIATDPIDAARKTFNEIGSAVISGVYEGGIISGNMISDLRERRFI